VSALRRTVFRRTAFRRTIRAIYVVAAGALLAPRFIGAHERITTKVSWNREIAPIFEARCVGCHRSDGPPGSIPLSTYKEARPWAAAIKEEVMTRRMPKWAVARGYGDFANDPSLSPFEVALITAWVDGGAPEIVKSTGAAPPPVLQVPARYQPPRGIPRMLPCGDQPISGRLLGVRPQLEKGGEAGISVLLPSGRTEIVAWIRRYDPAFPDTFWLRHPLDLPRGSRLRVEAQGQCTIDVVVAR
jgi:hypothetical protein